MVLAESGTDDLFNVFRKRNEVVERIAIRRSIANLVLTIEVTYQYLEYRFPGRILPNSF